MKDRKFWESHIAKAQTRVQVLNSTMKLINQELGIRTSVTAPYRNKVKENKLISRWAHLRRVHNHWLERIGFYQGRILTLEQRTRYQRILRSPVI